MFKVGDKVIASRIFLGLGQGEVGFETDEIRKAPVDPNWESCFVPEMLQYIGTELTVIRGNDVTIQLSPGSWWWSPLSLDKVEDMNKDINYFSRDELRRIASNKKIPGRGKMTKQELFYAIYDTKPVEKKKKEEISLGKKLLNKIKRTATCHYAHRCDKEEFFFSHDICHARLKNRKIDEAVLNGCLTIPLSRIVSSRRSGMMRMRMVYILIAMSLLVALLLLLLHYVVGVSILSIYLSCMSL